MALKRRASTFDDDDFSYHNFSSSAFSSPASNSPIPPLPRDGFLYSPSPTRSIAHLNSRTRKRHRDNRPEEDIIYENTFRKLYEAQRTHHQDEDREQGCAMSEDVDMADGSGDVPPPQTMERNQRTLDSFFCARPSPRPEAVAHTSRADGIYGSSTTRALIPDAYDQGPHAAHALGTCSPFTYNARPNSCACNGAPNDTLRLGSPCAGGCGKPLCELCAYRGQGTCADCVRQNEMLATMGWPIPDRHDRMSHRMSLVWA